MALDLYRARTRAPEAGAPLVFAFHGTGGDETQFHDLIRQVAPAAGIVAPRGDVSEGGAARFFRRTGEGVYDMEDLARRTDAMARFMAAHRAENPGAPVYAFGYSNGANILASVMMARPDLVDRAGLMHPLIPWAPAPVAGLEGRRVLVTAGRRDPICPWPMTARLTGWLEAQGAEVETVAHEGGHEIRPEELQALARLLDHTR